MASRNEKLRILEQVQKILGIENDSLDMLPNIIQAMVRSLTQPPILVSFAYDATTGQFRQVATSRLPQVPEAYQAVSEAASKFAQTYNQLAVEVSKRVALDNEQGRVDEGVPKCNENERGVGSRSEGHGVGEVAAEGDSCSRSDE